ncbi:hypothetical protein BH24BAC1_BH24BAC1_10300 [soil metagenome]
MRKQDLEKKFGIPLKSFLKLRENVFLINTENQEKAILKFERLSKKKFLHGFRFNNEVKVYSGIDRRKLRHLRVPNVIKVEKRKNPHFLLEFVPKLDAKEVKASDFVNSYLELQLLEFPKKCYKDKINQVINGFFYRIVWVSLYTIRKKVNLLTCLKSIILYFQLEFACQKVKNMYLLHGDLTDKNVFY